MHSLLNVLLTTITTLQLVERYLYFLMDESPVKVCELMERMAKEGGMEVPANKHEQLVKMFRAQAVSEEETLDQIRETYEQDNYILDPHSAVGVRAAKAFPGTVCLATAHPAKFGDAVKQAIGVEAEPPASLQGLMNKETRCELLEADSQVIKDFMRNILGAR